MKRNVLLLVVACFLSMSTAVQPMKRLGDHQIAGDNHDDNLAIVEQAQPLGFDSIPNEMIECIILNIMGVMKTNKTKPWKSIQKLYRLKEVNSRIFECFPSEKYLAPFMGIPEMHFCATTGNWSRMIDLKINHKNRADRCIFFPCPFGFKPLDYANGVKHGNDKDILSSKPAIAALGTLRRAQLITAEQFAQYQEQLDVELELRNANSRVTFDQFKQCIARLNEVGGNINCTNSSDWNHGTALHDAASNGKLERLQELLKHKDIDVNVNPNPKPTDIITLPHSQTPLQCAVRNNNIECVKELLKSRGIEINARNKYGQTALHIGAYCGYLACIKELITCGANILDEDKDHDTALGSLVEKGNMDCLRELLNNIDKTTHKHIIRKALIKAAAWDRYEYFRELLTHISVNDQDSRGDSILHWTAYHGNVECLNQLLEHDEIQCDILNENGVSALHYASFNGKDKCIELLFNKAPNLINGQFNPDAIINDTNYGLYTPLHLAAQNGHVKTVRKLITCGADVTLTNQEGKTALDLAKLELEDKDLHDKKTAAYQEIIEVLQAAQNQEMIPEQQEHDENCNIQ